MGFHAPSGAEMAASGTKFKLLPDEEYLYEVKAVDVNDNFNDMYTGKTRTQLTVKLRPISFADKSPLVDVDGGDVPDDKEVWDFIDPTKVGMKPQPSRARKFFTAALGVPLDGQIDIDDWQDLIGARVLAVTGTKPATGDKPAKNRIESYRAVPRRPQRAAAPVVEDSEDTFEKALGAPSLPGEKLSGKAAQKPLDDEEDF